MTYAAPYQQKSKTRSALSIAGVAVTLGLAAAVIMKPQTRQPVLTLRQAGRCKTSNC